ncbi:hypothetical protein FACS1894105_10960 [Clostridia bacterium]|nr:hypothetical protein FACS1894105_10960 [Clostridia bacterium]
MKYTEQRTVGYYDCDFSGTLSPRRYAAFMHEVAYNACKKLGPSPDKMRERTIAFFLSGINFKFYASVREDDILDITTWANPAKGAFWPRNYSVSRCNELIAEAASIWTIVNTETRVITRPDALTGIDLPLCGDTLSFTANRKLPIPESAETIGEHTINLAEIDTNGHMNNSVYLDLIYAHLPVSELKPFRINAIDLAYSGEAKLGETITINRAVESDCVYISSKRADNKPCFESKVTCENLLPR